MKLFLHFSNHQTGESHQNINTRIRDFICQLEHKPSSSSKIIILPPQRTSKKPLTIKHNLSLCKKADILICGTDQHDLETGLYCQTAISSSKPIIVLTADYHHSQDSIYDSLNYDKLLVYECNLINYNQIIIHALADASRLTQKRFTLLLSSNEINILNHKHRTTGINRSQYIRNLIHKDHSPETTQATNHI